MKNLPYILSYIKQDVYTFLFHILCLSCSHSSYLLRHLSLRSSTSLLTLRQRVQPFLSGRCQFFRVLHLGFCYHGLPTRCHTRYRIIIRNFYNIQHSAIFCAISDVSLFMLLCILKGISTYIYHFQRVTIPYRQFNKKRQQYTYF